MGNSTLPQQLAQVVMPSKTLLFIHGMYLTPLCWEHWLDYFQPKGYRCIAPPWPDRNRPIRTLRKIHPDPLLGRLTLSRVVDHYASLIHMLEEKPILIGHSMGGLVAQILLQRYEAIGGIAINSAPPRSIFTPTLILKKSNWPQLKKFIKLNWPHLNPFISQSEPVLMTLDRFQSTFVNGLPEEKQQSAFERYVVPESRRVPAEALTKAAAIDFHSPHPPLLLVAGANDQLIPPLLSETACEKYRSSPAITDFKEFPELAHFLLVQPGWEEVAGYIATWLAEKGV